MASGDTLAIFTALNSVPPGTNYAGLDIRNNHPVLYFDDATEWAIYFEWLLPRHYAGGGLTILLHWLGKTATSGDVKWGTSIERENTDLDADSFAGENTGTGTANGTSGIETVTSIAHTDGAQIDSMVVGDAYRLKVARKAADGADTMTGFAQLSRIEIRET